MGKRKTPEQKLMEAIFGKNYEKNEKFKERYYERQAERMSHEEMLAAWGMTEEDWEEHMQKFLDKVHEYNEKSRPSLKLVLNYKWYDMVEAGIKKEEYRDITPYWDKRLERYARLLREGESANVTFYRGYAKDRKRITYQILSITQGTGREEWGAEPGKQYHRIQLGDRMP